VPPPTRSPSEQGGSSAGPTQAGPRPLGGAADVPVGRGADILRVLVTRPAAQAREWVERLRAHGLDAAALPLIGIEPAADAQALREAWATLGTRQLAVFVSPNAVEQFFALRPAGTAWPAATRAASPGPGTTRVLLQLGVPRGCIVEPAADAAQFDSESLWAELAPLPWQGARVLVVRGDGGRDWLVERLRGAGAEVQTLAAYRRAPPRPDAAERALLDAALAAPQAALWWFSSSEAIDNLAALVGPTHDWRAARALATHPRIAARARALGFGTVHEVRPAPGDVLQALDTIVRP
jgi:uroporphyrinogen-III synthase